MNLCVTSPVSNTLSRRVSDLDFKLWYAQLYAYKSAIYIYLHVYIYIYTYVYIDTTKYIYRYIYTVDILHYYTHGTHGMYVSNFIVIFAWSNLRIFSGPQAHSLRSDGQSP